MSDWLELKIFIKENTEFNQIKIGEYLINKRINKLYNRKLS